MSAPIFPSQVRPLVTTRPPPTERLAKAYYTPLMVPTPVGTRVPRPDKTEDTISGFLRIEAGGGNLRGEMLLWDISIILHAYAPNTQEAMAEQVIADAIAWGANAQGIIIPLDNDNWYVTYSRCTGNITRKADPLVSLTRYRGMVTWRVPGLLMVPGQQPSGGGTATATVVTPQKTNAPRPSRKRR